MLWINGYIAWFSLMSSPHVPFHKYIHHRLYQMMSCGQIVILDVRKSFPDLSAFGNRTAPGKPDWWSWVARSSATSPASITMKILSLVWLYHQFLIFHVPINHIHTPRSSQRHFIIYFVICVSSTQRLWVESEQWPRDWSYVSMNDTSLILIQTGYIGLMSLRPINPRHYHIVFYNSMAILAT